MASGRRHTTIFQPLKYFFGGNLEASKCFLHQLIIIFNKTEIKIKFGNCQPSAANWVKSVQTRIFSGLYFLEVSPNTEKYGTEKLRIWTLFTQWLSKELILTRKKLDNVKKTLYISPLVIFKIFTNSSSRLEELPAIYKIIIIHQS